MYKEINSCQTIYHNILFLKESFKNMIVSDFERSFVKGLLYHLSNRYLYQYLMIKKICFDTKLVVSKDIVHSLPMFYVSVISDFHERNAMKFELYLIIESSSDQNL